MHNLSYGNVFVFCCVNVNLTSRPPVLSLSTKNFAQKLYFSSLKTLKPKKEKAKWIG